VELYLSPPPPYPTGVVLNSLGTKTVLFLGCVIPEKTVIIIFPTMLGQCMSEFSKPVLGHWCFTVFKLLLIKIFRAYV
jgi:hypothetical protein